MPRRANLRILIAHPEPIVRYGLRSLIEDEPDFQLVGEAEDGAEALRIARQFHPDLALIGAMPLICYAALNTAVMVLAVDNEEAAALAAIRAGAAAYLFRDAQVDDVLRAIRSVAAGQTVLPRSVVRMVHDNCFEQLSDREIGVVQLISRGLSNKQLACELGITLSTVKSHVSAILAKLGLSSRTQLALYAARSGRATLDYPLDRLTQSVPPGRVG